MNREKSTGNEELYPRRRCLNMTVRKGERQTLPVCFGLRASHPCFLYRPTLFAFDRPNENPDEYKRGNRKEQLFPPPPTRSINEGQREMDVFAFTYLQAGPHGELAS